jgi:hypothetical protein
MVDGNQCGPNADRARSLATLALGSRNLRKEYERRMITPISRSARPGRAFAALGKPPEVAPSKTRAPLEEVARKVRQGVGELDYPVPMEFANDLCDSMRAICTVECSI